jgi:hypothetical protein
MVLLDILSRVYHVLGDDIATPRWFTRTRLVALANRGCLEFRSAIEDEWYSQDTALQANVDTYSYRAGNLRAQRIAYAGVTLEPRGVVGVFTGQDDRWQSHTGAAPAYWSSDALPHDQFRVVPAPSVASTESWTFTSESGDITVTSDASGAYSFSSESGVVLAVFGFSPDSEDGTIISLASDGADVLTVWGTLAPTDMVADGDEVPIKGAFELALVWYTLWRTYEEETDHHNRELAGLYKKFWDLEIEQAKELSENPFPRMVNIIAGPGRYGSSVFIRPSDTIHTSGGDVTVTW